MALPVSTWNASYTFVAVFTGALVSVLAITAGMFMLHTRHVFEDIDAELPVDFTFFSGLGLPGIAVVWLGFLAVVGAMFLCERQKLAVCVISAAATASGLFFFMMLSSSIGMWFRVHFFII